MKKTIYSFLISALALLCHNIRAQSLSLNTTGGVQCFAGTNAATVSVNTAPAGTTTFSWSVMGTPPCAPGYSVINSNSAIAISFSCCGLYTFVCNAYNGATVVGTMTSVCNIQCTPSLAISASSNSMCAGGVATLTASGGSSYTWTPYNATGASIAISPTVNTCYTVTGSNSSGCLSNANICLTLFPLPNVTASASSSTLCAGSTSTLTASGAFAYTWTPGLVSGSSFVATPSVSTCYTVTGSSSSGCQWHAAVCLSVTPAPVLTVVPSSTVVCSGNSATLAASGANTYAWSTGATSPTVSVLTTTSSPATITYTLAGTNTITGCTGIATSSLLINPACSMVWPGDANSNGTVDNTDVFEIGLAFGDTGSVRASGSNAYTAQYCNHWSGNGSTGANKCHADCNGDGTVNMADTLAIYNNYLQTHAFRGAATSANTDLTFESNTPVILSLWNTFDVVLGSSIPASQVYGIAFDINYDTLAVEANSAYLTYPSSFLNASNQNVQFRKTKGIGGKIYATSVRTDGNNVSGSGAIAQLHIKFKAPTIAFNALNLSFSNPQAINANGALSALNGGTLSVTGILPEGIATQSLLQSQVKLFPNPATAQVMLQSTSSTEINYSVFDLSGRALVNGTFVSSKTIDLGKFESGIYLVKMDNGATTVYKKLILEK